MSGIALTNIVGHMGPADMKGRIARTNGMDIRTRLHSKIRWEGVQCIASQWRIVEINFDGVGVE